MEHDGGRTLEEILRDVTTKKTAFERLLVCDNCAVEGCPGCLPSKVPTKVVPSKLTRLAKAKLAVERAQAGFIARDAQPPQ